MSFISIKTRNTLFCFVLIIYCSLSTKSFAQNVELDSLTNLLQKNIKEDTIRVNILTEIALKLYLAHIDSNLKYTNEALDLSYKLNYDNGKIKSLQSKGIYLYLKTEYDESLRCFQKSLELNQKNENKNKIANDLNNIGIIYWRKSKYPQALECFQQSLQINNEIGNRKATALQLNNIGLIHKKQENYILSLKYFKKSLEINEEFENVKGISMCFNNIGEIYSLQDSLYSALRYYSRALNNYREMGDNRSISVCLANIGDTYLKQENYVKAYNYFKEALLIAKNSDDKLHVCSLYYSVGLFYLKTKNYNKSLNYTKRSLQIAMELDLPYDKKNIYKQLSEIYKSQGDYRGAYENLLLYKQLNDSIFKKENSEIITSLELQYKYENEKKINMLIEQKAEKELEYIKIIRNTLIIGFIIVMLILFMYMRLLTKKKKVNSILVNKNKETLLQKDQIIEQKLESQRINKELFDHKENLEKRIIQRTIDLSKEKEKAEKSDKRVKAINIRLSENINFTEKLLNATPNPVCFKDVNGKYIGCNKAFETFFGFSEDIIKGKTSFDLWPADKAKNCQKTDFELLRKAKPQEYETKLTDRNGKEKEVIVLKNIFHDAKYDTAGIISSFTDISKLKENERKLEFERERAEMSDRLKTEFLQNVSHEVRTPMNGILGFLSLLEEPTLSTEDHNEFLSIIRSSGEQLLYIIDEIMDMSMIETGQTKNKLSKVCLNNLFHEHFLFFKTKASTKNISISFSSEISDKRSTILIDRNRLNKILNAIIENAVKYTKKGFIEFGYNLISKNKLPMLEIYIKDTGIGIEPENQDIIFERFSQGEKELSDNVGGLGLGLSIAKANAELLGGEISVQSAKGKGSTFLIFVPYKSVNK